MRTQLNEIEWLDKVQKNFKYDGELKPEARLGYNPSTGCICAECRLGYPCSQLNEWNPTPSFTTPIYTGNNCEMYRQNGYDYIRSTDGSVASVGTPTGVFETTSMTWVRVE